MHKLNTLQKQYQDKSTSSILEQSNDAQKMLQKQIFS